MNDLTIFTLKSIRKLYRYYNNGRKSSYTTKYCDLIGQEANDYINEILTDDLLTGLMVSKFGTVELGSMVSSYFAEHPLTMEYLMDVMTDKATMEPKRSLRALCHNAGFFPYNMELGHKFYERMLSDVQEIDILGSYIFQEKYMAKYLTGVKKRVSIEGYYAPWLWEKPWTRNLRGKRVLVVHPFVESIRYQYEHNRTKIWQNPDVLPEFSELLTVKAVQSIANATDLPYKDWFEALKYMENEITKLDFDVAIIGCGAYGMCLAAHVKRMGRVAIHMAGWTQMLFGVYGNRWLYDQPEYANVINQHWIRPNKTERPKGAEKVENGCYW